MESRDLEAMDAFVDAHPQLKPAYDVWAQEESSMKWVYVLFPELRDCDDKSRYVLMNAIYACMDSRDEKMSFARAKTGCADLSEDDVKNLDVISYYERMSLDDLHRLGI